MSMHPDIVVLQRLADAAARLGGELARASFGGGISVRLKADASEVSEIDVAVERAVFAHLHAARPDDDFLGEEGVAFEHFSAGSARRSARSSGISWVIDPIDGTRNYIRGVPLFACSVAALQAGMPVAGAIYDPMTDMLFSAGAGRGALRNGRLLPRLSSTDEATTAVRNRTPIVAIPSAWRQESDALVRQIVRNCVIRSLGSATLHLVQVASGGIDATLMNNCKLWDIAAGALIVSECGGFVGRPDGAPLFPADADALSGGETPTLAGAPGICSQIIAWRA
ncbi:MAG: inositol monophosphatase [Planctomycetes bacterium]|nr:inositol monophosphatase [Planctomycetota bacterium]